MPTKSTDQAADAIMAMLDDRGCFNGIESDLRAEIREEIHNLILDILAG